MMNKKSIALGVLELSASLQVLAYQTTTTVDNLTPYDITISNSAGSVCNFTKRSITVCNKIDTTLPYKATYMSDQGHLQEVFQLQKTQQYDYTDIVHNATPRNPAIPTIHVSIKVTYKNKSIDPFYGDYSVLLDSSGNIQRGGGCQVPRGVPPTTIECSLYASYGANLGAIDNVLLTITATTTPWKPIIIPTPPTHTAKNGMQFTNLGQWDAATQQHTRKYAPNWSTTPTTFQEVEYKNLTYVACSQPNSDTVDPATTAKNGWGPWFVTDNNDLNAKKCN